MGAVDPRGLVEWNGTIAAAGVAAGVGSSLYRISVHSKCVNGKKGTAEIVAVGPSLGLEIKGTPPFSTTASSITLNDRLANVDPGVFNGWFSIWNVGVAFGPGFGCSAIQVGGNGMTLAGPNKSGATAASCGAQFGLELGAGGTAGAATVVKSSIEGCCDTK
jgi:hypothetical protein